MSDPATEKTHWPVADRAAVDEYMSNSPNVPDFSAVELVAEWERSCSERDNEVSRRYPTWSPEQLRSITRFSNSFFHSMDAFARGIARRITMDSPAELAVFLSLIARYEWANNGHTRTVPEAERERYFLSILQAMAANDITVAELFAESALAAPARKPGAREYAPVTAGVAALLLRDEAALQNAVAEMDRCKPKAYVAGMFETLRGAVSGSPAQVAAGLNKVLKAYPRYMMGDEVMQLIDPHAHGLFRLCHRYSANLTSQFDVGRSPPWDREFQAWWDADCDPLAGIDLTPIDPELQRVLIRLERPLWWDAEESAAW